MEHVCLSLSSRAVAEALRGITPRKPPENLFSDALLLSGVCVCACACVCVCASVLTDYIDTALFLQFPTL